MARSRILVCDDHDSLRRVTVAILAADGHEVEGVESVASAIASLAARAYDLLVLDLHLGEESGLRVLERVPDHPPVLLLSGDFDPAGGADAARYGVDAALAKPFESEELSAAVAALLR